MATESVKYLVKNRIAYYEYTVVSSLEAGISLVGTEVKSIRAGKVNLTDCYADIREGEVWLVGMHISEYSHGNINNHDPFRDRRLLLNSYEIRKLRSKVNEKGYTLVPLGLYLKRGKVKIELGLVKGKKLYDKRETIAAKDFKRDQERSIKY